MRHLLIFMSLWAAFVYAQAKDLIGSDQQAYSQDLQMTSETLAGDRYATVTGRLLMQGRLTTVVKLFTDIDNLPAWVENLIAAKEISARSPIDRSVYMRYSAPAGFDNRDGLTRFVASKASPTVLLMSIQDVPDYPLQANTVRMKDMRGRYRVEQVAPNLLAVEYRMHFDSGAGPAFLANLNAKQQAQKTLTRMRQRIEGPLQGASVDGALARALGLD